MPTEGMRPEPEVSLEEVGLSEEVVDVGLCADVTPVLEVSCSERMGIVVGVLPGVSEVFEFLVSVVEVVGSVESVLAGVEVGSARINGQR